MQWIDTHEEDAAAGLPEYLQRPRFQTQLRVFGRRVQELEDALRSLEEGWRFSNAQGAQLEGIGDLLVQGRGALADSEYRLRLQARIRILRGSATPDELIALLLGLNPSLRVRLVEEYPAAMDIQVAGGALPLPGVHLDLIAQAHGGGVRVLLSWQYAGDADTLMLHPLASVLTDEQSIRTGLGTVQNDNVGGILASSQPVSP